MRRRPPRPVPAHNLKRTRGGQLRRRNIVWRWRRLFYLLALVGVTGLTGAVFVVAQIELPVAPPVADQTTFICTSEVAPGQCDEDTAVAELHGEEDRVNVTLDAVAPVLIDAVIAAEDRDFFEHRGVDPVGIGRAAWADIRDSSASRQGGSTITQQYVKNVYLTSDRTLTRKIREAVMSIKLEQEMSKEEILEKYLNTIYFGRGAYGVQAASRAYFAKDVGELTLPEAALLAGLIRSPPRAEPYRYPDEARRRRRTVLDAMLVEGMITKEDRDRAHAWPFDVEHGLIEFTPSQGVEVAARARAVGADYFIEYVRARLTERYGSAAVFGGGLRVYTTLDLELQGMAKAAVETILDQPDDPAGALVAVDDAGQVRAMMGGRDFETDKVNLATGKQGGGTGRQPGSTFKAFALAQAIRDGYSIESLVLSPSSLVLPKANAGEDWTVRGGCCGGMTTLVEATARSANTTFAQLMIDLGPDRVASLARDLGVASDFGNAAGEPSLVLGAGEVSVLDMAAAYSTFANRGTRVTPRVITRVERADGTLVEEIAVDRAQVLSTGQADLVTYALGQVIDHGTGRVAALGRPAAGKTGTATNNRDAWFVGYTPRLTAAVWMGYAIPREMTSVHGQTVQGGNLPARIWKAFMEQALAGTEPESFVPPADLGAGTPLYPDLTLPVPEVPEVPPEGETPEGPTPGDPTDPPAGDGGEQPDAGGPPPAGDPDPPEQEFRPGA